MPWRVSETLAIGGVGSRFRSLTDGLPPRIEDGAVRAGVDSPLSARASTSRFAEQQEVCTSEEGVGQIGFGPGQDPE